VVILHQRFGTTCQSHPKDQEVPNVGREIRSMLCNIPEEHISFTEVTLAVSLVYCLPVCPLSCTITTQCRVSHTVSSLEALDIRNTFCQDVISLTVSLPDSRGSGVFVALSASKQLCSWQLDLCTWLSVLP